MIVTNLLLLAVLLKTFQISFMLKILFSIVQFLADLSDMTLSLPLSYFFVILLVVTTIQDLLWILVVFALVGIIA